MEAVVCHHKLTIVKNSWETLLVLLFGTLCMFMVLELETYKFEV
jgi:hypothetical protein